MASLRTLLGSASLSLGRVLELAAEVHELASRVLLRAHALPSNGVALTARLSYLHARVRFGLELTLASERPEARLEWRIVEWQSAGDAASDALGEAAVQICAQYTHGFGRLRGMLAALDAVFRPAALR